MHLKKVNLERIKKYCVKAVWTNCVKAAKKQSFTEPDARGVLHLWKWGLWANLKKILRCVNI